MGKPGVRILGCLKTWLVDLKQRTTTDININVRRTLLVLASERQLIQKKARRALKFVQCGNAPIPGDHNCHEVFGKSRSILQAAQMGEALV